MRPSLIVLAAGASARFGTDKRCMPLPGGQQLLAHCAGRLRAVADDVVVVLRPGDLALQRVLRRCGCRTVTNPQPDDGMGSSLAHGVRATPDADGWLVMPGDLPLLRLRTVEQVAARLQSADGVIPVCHGRRGHPVGFCRRFRDQLAALTGAVGGRRLLRLGDSRIAVLNVHDPGIYLDVDTPAEGRRLLSAIANYAAEENVPSGI